jgi:carboxypeptidase D
MVLLLSSYILSALACTALYPGPVSAKRFDRNHLKALQQNALDNHNKNALSLLATNGFDSKLNTGVKNITFSNPAASGEHLSLGLSGCADLGVLAFYVDGTTIPEVDWDIGPSWAGLLPVSGNANETRKVCCSLCPLV